MSVIVNSSLSNSNVLKILSNSYKTRVSSTTIRNTLIFPTSGLVFLLARDDKREPRFELLNDISRMSELHKECFVLSLETSLNHQLLFTLQDKCMDYNNVQVLFARSEIEAVECMNTVAKANHKGTSEKLHLLVTPLHPRWNDTERVKLMQEWGLLERECYCLLDSVGSVGGVLGASYEDLCHALQDRKLAAKVTNMIN